MRRACIDIGSNTTRLLVAECGNGELREIHQERAFTLIGRELLRDGAIGPGKLAEVVAVVTGQLRDARELGAVDVRGVATAAIRSATNGDALVQAIQSECGLVVEILSGEQEARLAFVGAARTLGHIPDGELGVIDVGGGSSEMVVGTAPDKVRWYASVGVGSGDLTDTFLHSDPPSAAELARARKQIARTMGDLETPRPADAVAVGGSAASLRTLAGPLLDADALAASLRLLASQRAGEIARRFAIDLERVRLMPAGLLILEAASELFGAALEVGRGGIREGVLLEAGSG